MLTHSKDSQRGHIIGPSWVLCLHAWLFMCIIQDSQNIRNLLLLFCDWGRLIKPSFYFPSDTLICSAPKAFEFAESFSKPARSFAPWMTDVPWIAPRTFESHQVAISLILNFCKYVADEQLSFEKKAKQAPTMPACGNFVSFEKLSANSKAFGA